MIGPVHDSDIQSKPPPGLLELDDFSIRPLGLEDFPLVTSLLHSVPPEVFELPATDPMFRAFVGELFTKPWSLPFACFHSSEPVGLCFMNAGQLKNLNAYLVALFSRPAEAALPLALYIRHAFWTFPLHRLYAQLPALPAVVPSIDALIAVGFKREGILVAHIGTPDEPTDAIAVGLLREEFDGWCEQNDPRLVLK